MQNGARHSFSSVLQDGAAASRQSGFSVNTGSFFLTPHPNFSAAPPGSRGPRTRSGAPRHRGARRRSSEADRSPPRPSPSSALALPSQQLPPFPPCPEPPPWLGALPPKAGTGLRAPLPARPSWAGRRACGEAVRQRTTSAFRTAAVSPRGAGSAVSAGRPLGHARPPPSAAGSSLELIAP